MIYQNDRVEKLRRKYTTGMRIRLIRMDDFQAPPSGTMGTVMGVDDAGSVMVSLDTGSRLSVIPDLDEIEILGEK